jgi:hypothetical protein
MGDDECIGATDPRGDFAGKQSQECLRWQDSGRENGNYTQIHKSQLASGHCRSAENASLRKASGPEIGRESEMSPQTGVSARGVRRGDREISRVSPLGPSSKLVSGGPESAKAMGTAIYFRTMRPLSQDSLAASACGAKGEGGRTPPPPSANRSTRGKPSTDHMCDAGPSRFGRRLPSLDKMHSGQVLTVEISGSSAQPTLRR